MKIYTTMLVCACAISAAANPAHAVKDASHPGNTAAKRGGPDLKLLPSDVPGKKAWYDDIVGSLSRIFGAGNHRRDKLFVKHDHPTQRKVPGGEHHQVGPLIPGETVDHARKYGHFTTKQLVEIEKELIKYAAAHHAEIEAMRRFRKTLPIDPYMWSATDKKRMDVRYKANVAKVKQLAKDSRAVAAKWRIPPKNIGHREKTYVLDDKHLAQISNHLALLGTKAEGWNDQQRADFRADLDKYVELETQVLEQVATDKAQETAARESLQPGATMPPTKKKPLTPEMSKARDLRATLENAVHQFRHQEL